MSDNGRRTIRIGDIGQVITGKTPPTSQPELFGNDYPFITPTDIKTFDIRYLQSTERGLSKKGYELLQKYLIPKDSICYVCIGSTIGKMCMTSHDCFTNQQINSIIVNKKKFDPKYIYYLLRTITPKIKAIAGGSGAGKEIINKSSFESIYLTVHDLSSQKRIGDILSTFDDLIENNTRRIAILEEMARSLYREWFVNFRFPGHEEVKMVDSPLGPIPEGWKVGAFTDIADVLNGGTPKTNVPEYWDGTIPFFSPRDAPPNFYVVDTEKRITELGLKSCNSGLYPKNTIFITARGTVGKLALTARDMAMNQSCYALQGKRGYSQYFVFLTIQNYVDRLQQYASGATFDAITIDDFKILRIIISPYEIINRFSKIMSTKFDLILNLANTNTLLRRTRDLLLPRLISGEIDVSKFGNAAIAELP
ncbi:MAG: restriction endonuclease subunit S [Firmicutes bacterium]|nr:restriction endonuclease subunit S [Bacillota bacterium]